MFATQKRQELVILWRRPSGGDRDRDSQPVLQFSTLVWHWFRGSAASELIPCLLQSAFPLRRDLYGTMAVGLRIHVGAIVSGFLLGDLYSFYFLFDGQSSQVPKTDVLYAPLPSASLCHTDYPLQEPCTREGQGLDERLRPDEGSRLEEGLGLDEELGLDEGLGYDASGAVPTQPSLVGT